MKQFGYLFALVLSSFTPVNLMGQVFVNGQSADLVLGQENFTSNTPELGPSRMNRPWGLASDPQTGVLFVSDSDNHRILRFSNLAAAVNGAEPEAVFGQVDLNSNNSNQGGTASANTLHTPRGIALDASGNLWVVDVENQRVIAYPNAVTSGSNPAAFLALGQPNFTSIDPDTTANRFYYPDGLAISPNGTLWVADTGNNRVLRFDNAAAKSNGADADGVLGRSDFTTSGSGTTSARMKAPYDVAIDSTDTLWVADRDNHRVLRFDNASAKMNGEAADGVLGQMDFTTGSTGLAANRFHAPYGVHLTPSGTLWVADRGNNRVLAFPAASTLAPGSNASVVLGQNDFITKTQLAPAAGFFFPSRITSIPGGGLFVSDGGNHRVLRFTPVAPPQLTILTRKATTTRGSYTVKGSTSGIVTSVSARVGKTGRFATAKGTTNWSYRARLKPGKNLVSAFATGPGGKSSPKSVKITRK